MAHPAPPARHALIIGATDGIGLALTRRLLAEGWSVLGLSRRAAAIEHPRYTGATLDVSSPGYGGALAALLERHGTPEVTVYCAGVGEPFASHGVGNDAHTLAVNLLGAAATVEALIPALDRRGGGHLIGLSSLADATPSPDAPSYAASKAGLSAYLVGLGLALRARGIRVTNVRLGFVDTKMAKSPIKPFMISPEAAANLVFDCIRRRPLQVTHPWPMALLMALIAALRWLRIRLA